MDHILGAKRVDELVLIESRRPKSALSHRLMQVGRNFITAGHVVVDSACKEVHLVSLATEIL